VVNIDETLTNGIVGLVLSTAGTYLIAMGKCAETLDGEHHENLQRQENELASKEELIKELRAESLELRKRKRTPLEGKHREALKKRLQNYGEDEKTFLNHLAIHGKIVHHHSGEISPPAQAFTVGKTISILNKLMGDKMVTPENRSLPAGWANTWRISPGAMSTLNESLRSSNSPSRLSPLFSN
jgi:hypothetical protein